MRAIRQEIPSDTREQMAIAAAKHWTENPFLQSAQHIAVYAATTSEFSCLPLLEMLWKNQRQCYLPVMMPNSFLSFKPYTAKTPLKLNATGIWEPEEDNAIEVAALDVVVMPLLAFDLAGNRLGMGGGYYDRTFQFLRESGNTRPFLLGLAYEKQCVETLPCEEWDVKLGGALTERRVVFFK